MLFSMNKRNEKALVFGTRCLQKVRFSYTVIIPKALVTALGMKEGDNIGFELSKEGRVFLQIEGEEQ